MLEQLSRSIHPLSTLQHGCRVVQTFIQTAVSNGLDITSVVDGFIEGGAAVLPPPCSVSALRPPLPPSPSLLYSLAPAARLARIIANTSAPSPSR